MADSTREQLRRAYDHIKGDRKMSAIQILRVVLEADPNNADAWWLMANAVDDPAEQRAAVEKTIALNPSHAQANERLAAIKSSEEFQFEQPETSFAELIGEPKSKRVPLESFVEVVPPRRGTNPIIIILAIIGALALAVCAGCFVLSLQVTTIVTDIVETVEQIITETPFSALGNGQPLPDDTNNKGPINVGDTRQETLTGTFDKHAYTFIGDTGQEITIRVKSSGNANAAPTIALYNPSDIQIAQSSPFGTMTNQGELVITLPRSGKYTILVSGFITNGEYSLSLSS